MVNQFEDSSWKDPTLEDDSPSLVGLVDSLMQDSPESVAMKIQDHNEVVRKIFVRHPVVLEMYGDRVHLSGKPVRGMLPSYILQRRNQDTFDQKDTFDLYNGGEFIGTVVSLEVPDGERYRQI